MALQSEAAQPWQQCAPLVPALLPFSAEFLLEVALKRQRHLKQVAKRWPSSEIADSSPQLLIFAAGFELN
jgi:hypothetical protein